MKKRLGLSLVGLLMSGLACRQQAVAPAGCGFVVQRAWTATESDTYTYLVDATNQLTQVVYRSANTETNYRYRYQGRQATIEVEFIGSDWIRVHYEVRLNERGYATSAQETTEQRINGIVESRLTGWHTFSYDADGHLTEHQVDKFSYPVGKDKITTTYWQRIGYVAGNPVLITSNAGTINNRYGTDANPIRLPLHLEADRQTFVLSPLQPLLGKPPLNLITFTKVTTTQGTDSTRYEYQFDATGQLTRTVLQPGNPKTYAYVPYTYAYKNTCP